MNEHKKPTPITVNNIEVPWDLQLIIIDLINVWNEKRIIGIYRNDPDLTTDPKDDEQKIVIWITNSK